MISQSNVFGLLRVCDKYDIKLLVANELQPYIKAYGVDFSTHGPGDWLQLAVSLEPTSPSILRRVLADMHAKLPRLVSSATAAPRTATTATEVTFGGGGAAAAGGGGGGGGGDASSSSPAALVTLPLAALIECMTAVNKRQEAASAAITQVGPILASAVAHIRSYVKAKSGQFQQEQPPKMPYQTSTYVVSRSRSLSLPITGSSHGPQRVTSSILLQDANLLESVAGKLTSAMNLLLAK